MKVLAQKIHATIELKLIKNDNEYLITAKNVDDINSKEITMFKYGNSHEFASLDGNTVLESYLKSNLGR